jgi:hypothetical protein
VAHAPSRNMKTEILTKIKFKLMGFIFENCIILHANKDTFTQDYFKFIEFFMHN